MNRLRDEAHDDRPLVSVVMPCYNAAPYLEEAVGSALNQTYGNVELILVDDGSMDGSADLAARLATTYPGRLLLAHANRLGPYPARNQALRLIRGDLVAFLDADDWWDARALEKLYLAMISAQADIAYCGWQNVGRGSIPRPMCRLPTKAMTPWHTLCVLVLGQSMPRWCVAAWSIAWGASPNADLRLWTTTSGCVRWPSRAASF